MRTTATIKGHPIHQMLIPFPIAFLTGSMIFDILGTVMSKQIFWVMGAYLSAAGIILAVAAAIPGFIDYLYTVPPKSTGKQRATKHMIVNLSSVSIFLAALLIRLPAENEPPYIILIMEILAVALLTIGGWMGGTMVTRNFFGPDHRYAQAGKWKQESFTGKKGESIKVGEVNELKTNQMKLLIINRKRIVLAKTEDKFTAFDDSCTHRGGSLAGGVMICGTVQCLWHGSQFDVKTGAVKSGPAEKKINTYKIEIKNNDIFIIT